MTDTEPRRIAETPDAPVDLVQALTFARGMAPSSDSRDAILAGVLDGLGFGPGPGGGPEGPGPGPGSPGLAPTSTALIKAGAAAAVGAAVAYAIVSTQQSAPQPTAPTTASAMVTTTVEEESADTVIPSAEPTSTASAEPSATADLERPTAIAPAPPPETELLSQAQQALASNPALALRLCGEHAKHHPAGALGQEREVIAIDALMRLGRGAEAKARGEAFKQRYPSSGHNRRIDVLLGH